MRQILFIKAFMISLTFFVSTLQSSEEQIVKRIHDHLIICDYNSASDEGSAGLILYPQSKAIWQGYIRALAKAGNEKLAISKWRLFLDQFPQESSNREMLECLAWAVINKGAISPSPLIRISSMLGAFFSQDAKGIPILQQGMKDDNSFLRAATIQLVANLHDASLQDDLLRLFKEEPVWSVRLEAIKAVGKLKNPKARPGLESILLQDHTHIEEKTAAIKALVIMSNEINQNQIEHLVKSDRVGLRLLGCEFITHFEQRQDVNWLFPLLDDYHASVRAKVLQTLGILRIDQIAGQSVAHLAIKYGADPDPLVATTAAWLLMLHDSENGNRLFQQLLQDKNEETRHLAAAALSSLGKYGRPLAQKIFSSEIDPYVKMNLAIGLIGQRVDVIAACHCLFLGLREQKEKWAWRNEGQFRILSPSKVKHDETNANYPETVNQLTRLEILEILAFLKYPYTQNALKQFLLTSQWGVSGVASALLLTEGDENAVDLVKELLKDPDLKIKVQAALILALWGEGEGALIILQNAYKTADRDLKGRILEGIGRVGSLSSLSFLAEQLQEPHQSLRIIAAAALLECLYN